MKNPMNDSIDNFEKSNQIKMNKNICTESQDNLFFSMITRILLSSVVNNSITNSTAESTGLKTKNYKTYFLHR